MTKRRKFSPEFKREAVKLTQQPGISCSQVALEIGVARGCNSFVVTLGLLRKKLGKTVGYP